ncbi:MAG: energy-coupling factor ABC transporter ATP-binding protein [Burkholderiales bacterium]|jgi:cobalt/nickel transport system ATP-binding protein|nr:energy-coupling factor ABC transporter ATP-binding protein [Burkholderiales bacterium]
MTASPDILQVRGLRHHYEDGTATLKGIDFTVREGECLGIVGANGAGKSTLLQLLAGCLEADSGEVSLDGVPLYKEKNKARPPIGLVFQDADDQLFMPTVWEDVAFGLAARGVEAAALKHEAVAVLKTLHATHLAGRTPHRLSGGEKRIAATAAVLAMSPRILALDEPTAALDPRARRHWMALLKAMPSTRIVASHDLDMVLDVCDRVLVMHQGNIARESEVPGCLRDAAFLRDCGLELPLRYEA